MKEIKEYIQEISKNASDLKISIILIDISKIIKGAFGNTQNCYVFTHFVEDNY